MPFVYKQHSKYDAPFKKERCAASVAQGGRMMGFYQCQRKGKYRDNEDRLWCKQHHPDTAKERKDKREAEWDAQQDRKMEIWNRQTLEKRACEGVPDDILENIRLKDLLDEGEPDAKPIP